MCAKFKTREEAEYFRRTSGHWATFSSGSPFDTTIAPPSPGRNIALWPTLVPREEVPTKLIMREVK